MHDRAERLRRARLLLAVTLPMLMAVVVALVVLRPAATERSTPAAAANLRASGYAGSVLPEGFRVPPFSLTTQEGERVTRRSLAGSPSFLTFTYSNCDETCPLQVKLIRDAMGELGRDVPAFAFSVDPANDTRTSATRFLAKQRALGRMEFLLGTRRALVPVWRGFGVQPQTKELEHHARIVLADGRGFQRVGYSASDVTARQLAEDYERLARSTDP